MKLIKKIIRFIMRREEYYPNRYILLYYILKEIQKIMIKIIPGKRKSFLKNDMFNWSLYHIHYKGELLVVGKNSTIDLQSNDYHFENNKLIKNNKTIKPLHPNHQLLYETIIQLHPTSIFEMGCGTGMHLNNLQTLLPSANLYGMDVSEKQIIQLRKNYPFLNASIKVADATTPFPKNFLPKSDLAFTQAVIMHIHTGEKHLTALANLFNSAKHHVILMESCKNHPMMENIKNLFSKKEINWGKINFYYKILKIKGNPACIICSNQTLDYPVLKDYNFLLNR